MKILNESEDAPLEDDDLPEYAPGQLAQRLKTAEIGKYAPKDGKMVHLVRLDDDVFKVFPSAEAVNDALRQIINQRTAAV